MTIISPLDREALRDQFRRARPFPWLMIDGFLEEGFAEQVASSYPTFEEATKIGRRFRAVNESRKVQIVESASFPPQVKQLADALSHSAFLADLEFVTGIRGLLWDPEFIGGGMHETARSGWLDVHVDFNLHPDLGAHRRLNILLFLNPGWDESWGGRLELWDRDVKTCIHSLAPLHNRCVIFETSEESWHGVTGVACPPNVTRRSFAAYYYTMEAPRGWDGRSHTTVFRARPEEHLKRYALMPAVSAGAGLRTTLRSLRRAFTGLAGRSSRD